MIFRAIEFAARAHSGQYRKGTKIPYIVHPLGVAKILIEYGCPDHVVIAGILHDTVEDTPVTLDEIKQTFGWDIADLVEAASEPDKTDTWENRKKHTIGMLKNMPKEAIILVLADKLDNIRAIREDYERYGEALWHRFNRPRDQQKWYYENLAAVFTDSLTDEQSRNLFDLFTSEVARVFGDVPHEERGRNIDI
jgi:(p)ppGpp synthase/HD superfamily hydrolase